MPEPIDALILALPESAGSALYGMVDVLAAAGTLWNELTGDGPVRALIRPRVVALTQTPFVCGNGIPVTPQAGIASDPTGQIVILPELWLAPDDDMKDRYDDVKAWIRRRFDTGSHIYSACSGAVLLAATGLLDGREATSHWGYGDLFRSAYPKIRFQPAPSLVFADRTGRIATAGGTTSWHDLALHIVSRHCSPGEALRIAKLYLLKWHSEGQLPYASLTRRQPHADAVIRRAEEFLRAAFVSDDALIQAVANAGIPERSFKRRFKRATGVSLIAYVQNLRVDEAKRLLETDRASADEVAAMVGYENPAFFRRLFRRCTGLTPGEYRRMFRPIANASLLARDEAAAGMEPAELTPK